MQAIRFAARQRKRSLLGRVTGLHARFLSGDAVPTRGQAPAIAKLLVANRGEIACRVLTSARRLGIPSVAVYSEADRHSKHVSLADEAYCIGPAPARESYLLSDRILAAARDCGATAVHPGYGFLSENTDFAAALEAAGLTFVGPPAAAIRAMGDKSQAKALMSAAGVPVVPGYLGEKQDPESLLAEADRIGYPVLIKAVLGGGGKGMKLAESRDQFLDALASARREALTGFGDDRVLLERYVQRPRHVEVQVVADAHGGVVHLFERDCSVQRRHQKVIEEAPAPGLSPALREALGASAVAAARAVGYRNAGTVEFILDTASDEHYFMEMNTRLQVEHPVTEAVTGVDLVEWQLRVAAGEPLPLRQEDVRLRGHAFEARIYAENPRRGFLPAGGVLRRWAQPAGAAEFEFQGPRDAPAVRVDSGVRAGDAVGVHYDPMIAKLIVRGADRADALARLDAALARTQVAGLPTNVEFVRRIAADADFRRGGVDTGFIPQREAELLAPEPEPSAAELALGALLVQSLDAKDAESDDLGDELSASPWLAADGFRVSLPGRAALGFEREGRRYGAVLAHDGNAVRVSVTDEADADAAPAAVTALDVSLTNDAISAEIDGKRLRGQYALMQLPDGAPDAQVVDLWLEDGRRVQLRRPIVRAWRRAGGAAAAGAGGQVAAPMPGKVVKLHVSVGDRVREGQALVALEAMKMEHSVVAPCDGVVAELAAKPEQQVGDGHVLVVVAAAAEEHAEAA